MWRLGRRAPHPNVLCLLGACTQPPLIALLTPYCSKCVDLAPSVHLSWSDSQSLAEP